MMVLFFLLMKFIVLGFLLMQRLLESVRYFMLGNFFLMIFIIFLFVIVIMFIFIVLLVLNLKCKQRLLFMMNGLIFFSFLCLVIFEIVFFWRQLRLFFIYLVIFLVFFVLGYLRSGVCVILLFIRVVLMFFVVVKVEQLWFMFVMSVFLVVVRGM